MRLKTAQRLAEELGAYLRLEPMIVDARLSGDDDELVKLADLWVACATRIGRVRRTAEDEILAQRVEDYCPGCGAPKGYPPGGPCENHGTPEAVASNRSDSRQEAEDV